MQLKLPICYITGTGITITALFLMQARNNLNKGIFEYHVPYHGIPHNQRNELELSYFFQKSCSDVCFKCENRDKRVMYK